MLERCARDRRQLQSQSVSDVARNKSGSLALFLTFGRTWSRLTGFPIEARCGRNSASTLRRLALSFLLCACASTVYGQSDSIDREIKAMPGHEVRVGVYTSMRSDCTAGPLPAVRLSVTPEHGSVTVRRGTLKATNVKQCLAAELPAFVAFYRAKADSANDDHFELEVSFAAGRKQIQHFYFACRKRRTADLALEVVMATKRNTQQSCSRNCDRCGLKDKAARRRKRDVGRRLGARRNAQNRLWTGLSQRSAGERCRTSPGLP
jgi:hypothetical protein